MDNKVIDLIGKERWERRPVFPDKAVVTSGMPYGNKEMHFAHAALTLRADTFARFLRDRIGNDNVIFVSGTDCFGSTATETYRKLKESGNCEFKDVKEFVMHNHQLQKQTMQDYEISHNFFGASALEPMFSNHKKVSEYFVNTLQKANMLSKRSSLQFYDPKLKTLLNGRQVIGKCPIEGCPGEKGYADECDMGHQYSPVDLIDPVSALSGEKPELKKVENLYFDLDKCTDEMWNWLQSIERRGDTAPFMFKEIKEFLKKPEIYVKREIVETIKSLNLPKFEIVDKNGPSVNLVFEKLSDRETACEILTNNSIRYRTGKTLVPFRLTGNDSWGVPCPEIDGVKDQTFYVWPESLWAPISETQTYLKSLGKPEDEWKKFWCSADARVFQFIGEDNLSFYGPAQQAMWLHMQGTDPVFPAPDGQLQNTTIVPIKHLLFMNKKASSSGQVKAPKAKEFLNYYTPEQLRMHFLGMNVTNNNVSFLPKPLMPDAKPEEVDIVLKEGNLLTNVYNRILRTLFYTMQKELDGKIPHVPASDDVKKECANAILNYEKFMFDLKLHQVVNTVDVFVRNINKFWVKNYNSDASAEEKQQLIADTLQYVITANILLHPMSPKGTEKVADYLKLDKTKHFSWDYIFDNLQDVLKDSDSDQITFLKEKEDFFKKHPSQLAALEEKL